MDIKILENREQKIVARFMLRFNNLNINIFTPCNDCLVAEIVSSREQ